MLSSLFGIIVLGVIAMGLSRVFGHHHHDHHDDHHYHHHHDHHDHHHHH